jgi:hypothetical protein
MYPREISSRKFAAICKFQALLKFIFYEKKNPFCDDVNGIFATELNEESPKTVFSLLQNHHNGKSKGFFFTAEFFYNSSFISK